MTQNDETKQHPQCDRRNDEEINGANRLGVIVQEGRQDCAGGQPDPQHLLRHRRLGNIDPELDQLAMDAGCSPQRVAAADPADLVPRIEAVRRRLACLALIGKNLCSLAGLDETGLLCCAGD
jgi:hypothetical protein